MTKILMKFQFHKVRLKDISIHGAQRIVEFQFHKVRLKASRAGTFAA